MSVINLALELAEARAIGKGLRNAASACGPAQGVLRIRLAVAAEKLDQLASLSARALDRIEELEQQVGAKAGEHGAGTIGRPAAHSLTVVSNELDAEDFDVLARALDLLQRQVSAELATSLNNMAHFATFNLQSRILLLRGKLHALAAGGAQ